MTQETTDADPRTRLQLERLRDIEAAAEALSDAALDPAQDDSTPCRVPGWALRNLRKAMNA